MPGRSPRRCAVMKPECDAGCGTTRHPTRLGGSNQIVEMRVPARLCAVGDAELAICVRQVEFDRLLGHPQLAGDPAVRVPLRDQPQNLELAVCERAIGTVLLAG